MCQLAGQYVCNVCVWQWAVRIVCINEKTQSTKRVDRPGEESEKISQVWFITSWAQSAQVWYIWWDLSSTHQLPETGRTQPGRENKLRPILRLSHVCVLCMAMHIWTYTVGVNVCVWVLVDLSTVCCKCVNVCDKWIHSNVIKFPTISRVNWKL